jgi:putative ABC transport system substrate-binding protein
MRRRSLLGVIGGLLSGAALGQPAAKPKIGFISSRSEKDSAYLVAAFRRGLAEGGFVEGQNLTIDFRWADGYYQRLPALAADLVGRRIDLLVAVGGEPSALAAKAASGSTIPLIFTVGGDPVKAGLVDSLSRPGGNATGVSLLTTTPEAKRMELLIDLVPSATTVAALIDPEYQEAANQERELEDAARVLGKRLLIVRARSEAELDQAFEALATQRPSALLVTADPFFDTQRDRILSFANRQRLPAIYQFRDYAVAGGLMSYGISITEGYRLVGSYAAKVLKGAKPAELPVQQSVRFELVINTKTAKTLGLEIPLTLLARADEVIE